MVLVSKRGWLFYTSRSLSFARDFGWRLDPAKTPEVVKEHTPLPVTSGGAAIGKTLSDSYKLSQIKSEVNSFCHPSGPLRP
jgi:hypothetical protein